MNIIGLDIGGANLKAANTSGQAATLAFPLWQHPEQLTDQLRQLIRPLGPTHALAVTMTAELADCFETKQQGVDFILGKVQELGGGAPVLVWQTGSEFVSPEVARDIPLLVAAANWHALATWVGRMVPAGPALLLDIGSSTTDIIPLLDGRPVPQGMTDCERLLAGELLYTGFRRTPLCALASGVPLRGSTCPLAAEVFATTLDVHLLLQLIAEDAADCDTANGRPATRAAARDRLARMLCCDRTEISPAELLDVAGFLHEVQQQRIRGCLDKVRLRLPAPQAAAPHVLISGSGSRLAQACVGTHHVLSRSEVTLLDTVFDAATASAACATAVARLAAEYGVPQTL